MTTLRLKNGKILSCAAVEILSIPNYINISENEEKAQQFIENSFYEMLIECYRYCDPGNAVFELLWNTQSVSSSAQSGQIHLYIVLRVIAKTEAELNQRIGAVLNNMLEHLRICGLQFAQLDAAELVQSGIEIDGNISINAIVKSEQCTVHSQSVIPYYFSQTMPLHSCFDFAMISRTMINFPGSVLSFQLLPDVYTQEEAAAITEMYSMLTRITTGTVAASPNIFYQDSMAQNAKDSYEHIYKNLQQPFFRYNILTFGKEDQCASLSAQVVSLLKGGQEKQFLTINLNGEHLELKKQFLYYPWNLNTNIIRKYRDKQFWGAMQSMQLLFRIPYMITADEAVCFFRVPIDNAKVVGIAHRDVVQHIHDLDARAVNDDNIQIGKPVGEDHYKFEVGCPQKSLTKHVLIVGMPGTGKTTFSLRLLLQVCKKGIPFLAVEPTKTEYRALIDVVPDLQIFTPGNNGVSPFVINPFIPPKGITVEKYIPSLVSAFKAAFSMPSPLDAIFQQAIQETYVRYGWKDYSTAQDQDVTLFGLHEFIIEFKRLIERQKYSAEVKGNLQSGGILRLRNLIEQNANIYDTTQTIPLEDLLSKPTVLELNAIDNEEQKTVLMALLLINVCVYTKHNNLGDGLLKNMILIDEAHVLFKAGSTVENMQQSNSAVRSLESMLAEIRSYGTSIVIADQSPSAVGNEVVKNTDVKVVFRLVDANDRRTIASATNMTMVLEQHIPKLDVGQAFTSYEYLKEPILVQTPDVRDKENIRLSVGNEEIRNLNVYWRSHSQYLIPFGECGFSEPCQECSLRLRSDAAFYAAKFVQEYGNKIKDKESLYAYVKAIDVWIKRYNNDNMQHKKFSNCIKIRVLRRVLQQKDIMLSKLEYSKLLRACLNIE